jgi:hypothetical protein
VLLTNRGDKNFEDSHEQYFVQFLVATISTKPRRGDLKEVEMVKGEVKSQVRKTNVSPNIVSHRLSKAFAMTWRCGERGGSSGISIGSCTI